jgi:HicA toxin of bacterial toxin-antitoxin,
MARLDDEIAAFRECSGPYAWRDFVWLLGQLGYEPKKAGRTSGSRRKFQHKVTGHVIGLDEPHDGEMGKGMVKRLREELQDKGVI